MLIPACCSGRGQVHTFTRARPPARPRPRGGRCCGARPCRHRWPPAGPRVEDVVDRDERGQALAVGRIRRDEAGPRLLDGVAVARVEEVPELGVVERGVEVGADDGRHVDAAEPAGEGVEVVGPRRRCRSGRERRRGGTPAGTRGRTGRPRRRRPGARHSTGHVDTAVSGKRLQIPLPLVSGRGGGHGVRKAGRRGPPLAASRAARGRQLLQEQDVDVALAHERRRPRRRRPRRTRGCSS